MDPATFFAASRVVIVAGKGGVGKTTVTAALARAASLEGRSALIVEVEGKAGLAAMFGAEDLGYDEDVLVDGDEKAGVGEVRARTLTADEALLEYLQENRMNRVAKRLVSTGVLDVLATAAPGIRDILILGKVKQLEQRPRPPTSSSSTPPRPATPSPSCARPRRSRTACGSAPSTPRPTDVLELLERPGPLPGDARDPARGDAGQRAGRDRLLPRGGRRRHAGPGRRQRPLPASVTASTRRRPRPRPTPARSSSPDEADALDAAADFRRHRMALQHEQVARLERAAAAAAAPAAVPVHRRHRAPTTSTGSPTS